MKNACALEGPAVLPSQRPAITLLVNDGCVGFGLEPWFTHLSHYKFHPGPEDKGLDECWHVTQRKYRTGKLFRSRGEKVCLAGFGLGRGC